MLTQAKADQSIYCLGNNFLKGQTSYQAEVVSEKPESVFEEIKIKDVLEFLQELEGKGDLIIYRYPDKPRSAPKDKSDIIMRALKWAVESGEDTLKWVEKYHPDVLPEVLKRLEEYRKKQRERNH